MLGRRGDAAGLEKIDTVTEGRWNFPQSAMVGVGFAEVSKA